MQCQHGYHDPVGLQLLLRQHGTPNMASEGKTEQLQVQAALCSGIRPQVYATKHPTDPVRV